MPIKGAISKSNNRICRLVITYLREKRDRSHHKLLYLSGLEKIMIFF